MGLIALIAAAGGCARPSGNAADYVGEYIFTPGQNPPSEFADIVILQSDGTALEIRRSNSKSGITTKEVGWRLESIQQGRPDVAIGSFAHTVELSDKLIRLDVNDDLNQYYEKVR